MKSIRIFYQKFFISFFFFFFFVVKFSIYVNRLVFVMMAWNYYGNRTLLTACCFWKTGVTGVDINNSIRVVTIFHSGFLLVKQRKRHAGITIWLLPSSEVSTTGKAVHLFIDVIEGKNNAWRTLPDDENTRMVSGILLPFFFFFLHYYFFFINDTELFLWVFLLFKYCYGSRKSTKNSEK